MRTGRILPGIGVLNGRVFVVGGEFDSEILANGEVYDPHEDTWAPIASMSIPRYLVKIQIIFPLFQHISQNIYS